MGTVLLSPTDPRVAGLAGGPWVPCEVSRGCRHGAAAGLGHLRWPGAQAGPAGDCGALSLPRESQTL